jgi:hypothetical protein
MKADPHKKHRCSQKHDSFTAPKSENNLSVYQVMNNKQNTVCSNDRMLLGTKQNPQHTTMWMNFENMLSETIQSQMIIIWSYLNAM